MRRILVLNLSATLNLWNPEEGGLNMLRVPVPLHSRESEKINLWSSYSICTASSFVHFSAVFFLHDCVETAFPAISCEDFCTNIRLFIFKRNTHLIVGKINCNMLCIVHCPCQDSSPEGSKKINTFARKITKWIFLHDFQKNIPTPWCRKKVEIFTEKLNLF